MRPNNGWLTFTVAAFVLSAFILEAFIGGQLDYRAFILAVTVPAVIILQVLLFRRFHHGADRTLLLLVHFLCGLGLIMQYRLNPDTALKQLIFYLAGMALMHIAVLMVTRAFPLDKLRYVIMGATVAVMLVTGLLGRETYGAKNWIYFGDFSVQPSEFAKISLCIILAVYARRGRTRAKMLPSIVFAAACVMCLIIQKDLGASLTFFFVTLVVYFAATSDALLTGLGTVVGAGGAVLMYKLFDHVKVRVAIFINPWATTDTTGYQIVQSLMAISTGGLFGMGLGLGVPKSIPAYHTDFIFAVICEEMGILMGIIVIAIYALFIIRGVMITLNCRDRFHMALAFGITMLIAFQAFLIIGGVIKMIPLTGVTMPFVSYGGTSLLTCLIMTGLLEGVAIVNRRELEDARRKAAYHG